jgi:hypothetical protein
MACDARALVGYLERPQYLGNVDPGNQSIRSNLRLSTLIESYAMKRLGTQSSLLSSFSVLGDPWSIDVESTAWLSGTVCPGVQVPLTLFFFGA